MGVSSAKRGHLFYRYPIGFEVGCRGASHWTRGFSHDDGWADAPPIFFLRHQKENGPRPVEKKKCFGGSVCAGAALLPPAGDGWHPLAAVRDGNARPLGNPLARGCTGIHSASLSAAAHVSVKDQEARSEAERAEREAGQMRSCTPTPSAPSATGRQLRFRRRPKRARRQAQIGAGTDPPTPVSAEGNCTGARPSGLFFWTVQSRSRCLRMRHTPCGYGPFSFPQDGKENGGCIPAGQAPLAGARPPRPPQRRPYRLRQTSSSSDRS